MSQVEIGKKVNEIEGHEREAEEDRQPLLKSFALKEGKNTSRRISVIQHTRS